MALATQGMRNNLNLSYFVASEHSAIYAFCKNILCIFQLLALLTLDLWAVFGSRAVLLQIENSGRRTHMYSRLVSDFCVPEDCFNLWSPWPCLPRAGFVGMHSHAWFMCAMGPIPGLYACWVSMLGKHASTEPHLRPLVAQVHSFVSMLQDGLYPQGDLHLSLMTDNIWDFRIWGFFGHWQG